MCNLPMPARIASLLQSTFAAVALAAAASLSSLAFAAQAPATPASRSVLFVSETVAAPSGHLTVRRSFADMGMGRDPLRLGGWDAAYTIKLPKSPREVLTSARLTLSTVNSTALIRSRSELSVRLNGQVLGQYPLDPQSTTQLRDIELPVEMLLPGYNEILVRVVQHYTYECEDPSSPELWTELNPLQSGLTLNFAGLRTNSDPRLSQLHVAFDKRAWLPRPLAVVSATERFNEAQVQAAALAVQGLSLRKGHSQLDIQAHTANSAAAVRAQAGQFPGLSHELMQGRDVLLVGKRSELSRYLSPELYQLLAIGPFVGMFSSPTGESVVLVVSGNTEEELFRAARSLARPDFKFSDVAMETITGVVPFELRQLAAQGTRVQFADFNFRTTGSRGLGSAPVFMEFRAPADYNVAQGDLAKVRLHMSYGGGLRKDSSMQVRVNGQFAASVPLSKPEGGDFVGYEVNVPAQLIHPGYNYITFEPVFQVERERCDASSNEGLALTIYEDSTLELPRSSSPASAPDLARFARALWPADKEMRLHLPQPDAASVAAALTLASSQAQRNRAPFDVQVSFQPYESGHMLSLGPADSMPTLVTSSLPLKGHTWSAQSERIGFLQGVEGKRSITAVVAGDAATIQRSLQVMDAHGLWHQLDGQAAIVDARERTVSTQKPQKQTVFGEVSRINAVLGSWSKLGLLLGAAALLFTLTTITALRHTAKRRKHNEAEAHAHDHEQ